MFSDFIDSIFETNISVRSMVYHVSYFQMHSKANPTQRVSQTGESRGRSNSESVTQWCYQGPSLFTSLHSVFHRVSFILMLVSIMEAKTVVAILSITPTYCVVQNGTEHFFQQFPQKFLDFSSMSHWPKLGHESFLKPISVQIGQRNSMSWLCRLSQPVTTVRRIRLSWLV